jgi:hypothetical protein
LAKKRMVKIDTTLLSICFMLMVSYISPCRRKGLLLKT